MSNVALSNQLNKKMILAMRLSLAAGFVLLAIKLYAYMLTKSTAVLSDVLESTIHLFAVGFAAYSLRLSYKPADKDHTYGHDRIAFFSAGIEGLLIAFAACWIFYEAFQKMLYPVELSCLDLGALLMGIATVINTWLGFFLLEQGKKNHSLVLQADGKHLLTDALTSFGVLVAVLLTSWTKFYFLDPLIAIFIGLNIMRTACKLLVKCIKGLMDEADPSLDKKIRSFMERETKKEGVYFHNLRHRNCGNRQLVEIHLLFPDDPSLEEAHRIATKLEKRIEEYFEIPLELSTHLEPFRDHDKIHQEILGRADYH